MIMKIQIANITQQGNRTIVYYNVLTNTDYVIEPGTFRIEYCSLDGEADPILLELLEQYKAAKLAEYENIDEVALQTEREKQAAYAVYCQNWNQGDISRTIKVTAKRELIEYGGELNGMASNLKFRGVDFRLSQDEEKYIGYLEKIFESERSTFDYLQTIVAPAIEPKIIVEYLQTYEQFTV